MTSHHAKGFGALDLLAAMAVAGVMLGFAVPRISESDLALPQAHAQLVADLRNTRSDALISGDHFRLDVTGANTYAEYRLTLDDDEWTLVETPTRSRTLPAGLSFTSGVGASLEFNTRGVLVDADAATTLELFDARTGFVRHVAVWPSGQVAP